MGWRWESAWIVESGPRRYIRFQADLPNECWQADFTHYHLTRHDGGLGCEVEILSSLLPVSGPGPIP